MDDKQHTKRKSQLRYLFLTVKLLGCVGEQEKTLSLIYHLIAVLLRPEGTLSGRLSGKRIPILI